MLPNRRYWNSVAAASAVICFYRCTGYEVLVYLDATVVRTIQPLEERPDVVEKDFLLGQYTTREKLFRNTELISQSKSHRLVGKYPAFINKGFQLFQNQHKNRSAFGVNHQA
ncbi:hypothetical protein CLF_102364 [Clonorchis sinensis]|uniref:Uncharacterized protein n=1 Tax=Clonorchis sinensis TaxID=79923 RepID=G7Y7R6_CLOSI|nr:hypothetical protein CLF_102364 [Clonorchis sinensis]